jgi:hypothetical protein
VRLAPEAKCDRDVAGCDVVAQLAAEIHGRDPMPQVIARARRTI